MHNALVEVQKESSKVLLGAFLDTTVHVLANSATGCPYSLLLVHRHHARFSHQLPGLPVQGCDGLVQDLDERVLALPADVVGVVSIDAEEPDAAQIAQDCVFGLSFGQQI